MSIQQTIIEGIRLQLHRHAFIVLPGFGGFVLKQRPAHFTPAGSHLMPPSRTVSFNSQLRQNDGILASWLVERERCSVAQALEHLHDFANYCRGVLDNKRRLTLPGIGFFFLDFENNLCFEPLADHNFLPESFGLASVRVPATVPVRQAPVYPGRVAQQPVSGPSRRTRRIIVPAVLTGITILFLLAVISAGDFRGELRAAFNPAGKQNYQPVAFGPLELERPVAGPQPLISDANGVAVMRLPELTVAVDAGSDGSHDLAAAGERYEIILGCFAVPDNATRLVKRMKSRKIAAQILEERHRGMQVVAYGAFPDKESALQQLERVRGYVAAAWIRQVN